MWPGCGASAEAPSVVPPPVDEAPQPQEKPKQTYTAVVIGPPACGKGAICQSLVDQLGLVQLSTVKAYREALRSNGPEKECAEKAKQALDAYGEVPDDVNAKLLKFRIEQDDCQKKGWLIDGYPRTKVQADLLYSNGIKPGNLVNRPSPPPRAVPNQRSAIDSRIK